MVQPATPHCDLGANWQPIYGAETQKNLGSNLLITASSSSDIIEKKRERANSEPSKNFLAVVHYFGVILLLGGYRNFSVNERRSNQRTYYLLLQFDSKNFTIAEWDRGCVP